MSETVYQKFLELEDFLPENRVSILEYICPICKGVLLDPQQDKKGHVFCKRCIELHLLTSNKCPVDDHELSKDKIDSILFIINILEKQSVYCKNRLRECDWKGNLRLLEPHLVNDCMKQFLNCPNDGCTIKVIRQDLQIHLENCNYRLVKCDYCQKDACLKRLSLHYDECLKYPLDCIQNCGKMIERNEMDSHLKFFCDNTMSNCPYSKFGCKTVFMKKFHKEHLTSNYDDHNFIIVDFYQKFQTELVETINKSRKNTDDLLDKITSVEKKMTDLTTTLNDIDGNDLLGKKIAKSNLISDAKIVKRKKLEELDNKLIINY